jgi:hypothetical protein
MNLNFSGFPIGAAVAGVLVGFSIEAAIVFGVVANALGAVLAYLLIPRSDAEAESDGTPLPDGSPAGG